MSNTKLRVRLLGHIQQRYGKHERYAYHYRYPARGGYAACGIGTRGNAGKAEVMRKRRAGYHAEYGNGAVAVALAGKYELPERAAAEQDAAPTDQKHAKEIPNMIAMGNGLAGEAKIEMPRYKVARKHNHEYGHEAIQQLEIAEHHAVADAANHAKAAPLRQRADDGRRAAQPTRYTITTPRGTSATRLQIPVAPGGGFALKIEPADNK